MSDDSLGIRITGAVCPIPLSDYPSVQLAHGGGGRLSQILIEGMFAKAFDNPALELLHDGAVLLDSGVRSGQDILKVLAYGGDGVMLGRAHLYGLGAYGQKGVEKCFELMNYELDATTGLTGLTSATDDLDFPCGFNFECLVVRSVFFGLLGHQADVRYRAHRRGIEGSMFLAERNRFLV